MLLLYTQNEIISKFSFAKTQPYWEATSTPQGHIVTAIDCTQDEAILSAAKCREFINAIQQLRKSAGLDLANVVDIFYQSHDTDPLLNLQPNNVKAMLAKLKGVIPLPVSFKNPNHVVLGQDTVEIGNSKVHIMICRRILSTRDDLSDILKTFVTTVDPECVQQEMNFVIDGKEYVLKEGVDYWKTALDKARDTKAIDWI